MPLSRVLRFEFCTRCLDNFCVVFSPPPPGVSKRGFTPTNLDLGWGCHCLVCFLIEALHVPIERCATLIAVAKEPQRQQPEAQHGEDAVVVHRLVPALRKKTEQLWFWRSLPSCALT